MYTKSAFIPKIKHRKHTPYIKAYVGQVGIIEFFKFISKFLNDPNLSPSNAEDIGLFRSFLCDSKFGMLHITYCSYIVKNMNSKNYNSSVRKLVKYINYAGQTMIGYQEDIYEHLFRDVKNKVLLESLLKKLAPDDRLRFMNQAMVHSNIVEMIPKIKLYILYS